MKCWLCGLFFIVLFAGITSWGQGAHCDVCRQQAAHPFENLVKGADGIRKAACESLQEKLQCEQSAKAQNYSELLRSCQDEDIKKERTDFSALQAGYQCLKGVVMAVGGDLVKMAWDQAVQNLHDQNELIKTCNVTEGCREQLAKDSTTYKNFSKKQLEKISTEILYLEARENRFQQKLLRANGKATSLDAVKKSQEPRVNSNDNPEMLPLVGLAMEALKQKGIKLACLNQEAQAEMLCYSLTQILGIYTGAKFVMTKSFEVYNASKATIQISKHSSPVIDAGLFKNSKAYADFTKVANKQNDLGISYWKRMGIKVSEDGRLSLDSHEVAVNIMKENDRLIRAGKLDPSKRIDPVILYEKNGKIIEVSPLEEPPVGAKRVLDDVILDNDKHLELLEKGKAPMGTDSPTGPSGVDINKYTEATLIHDLNHFRSMQDYPEYGVHIPDVAKTIRATTDKNLKSIYQGRFLVSFEYSKVFPKEKVGQALQDLAATKKSMGFSADEIPNKSQYVEKLKTMSDQEIRALQKQISDSSTAQVYSEPIGGGGHILQHRFAGSVVEDSKNFPVAYQADNRLQAAEFRKVTARGNPVGQTSLPRDMAIDRISDYMARTDAFVRVRAEDWMTEPFQGKQLPKGGNLRRLCESGTYKATDTFFANFCH